MINFTPESARHSLLHAVEVGMTVHTILRYVSRSGMTKIVDPVIVRANGDVNNIGARVAMALDARYSHDHGGGVIVRGVNADMGALLVNDLAVTLFPVGFRCRESLPVSLPCPAIGDRCGEPGRVHTDGGMALRQAWL